MKTCPTRFGAHERKRTKFCSDECRATWNRVGSIIPLSRAEVLALRKRLAKDEAA